MPIKKVAKEVIASQRAIKEKMLTLILAASGLVAALAWNDAIQSFFNVFFPRGQGLIGKFLYAVLVTVIVVLISERLNKLLTEKENKEK